MNSFSINIGTVKEVESTYSKDGYDGLRVRAQLETDNQNNINEIPWAFPLLPKIFQSVPKEGEAVFVFMKDEGENCKAGKRIVSAAYISADQHDVDPRGGCHCHSCESRSAEREREVLLLCQRS